MDLIRCGGEYDFFPFLLYSSSDLNYYTYNSDRIDPTGEFSRQRQLSWLFWMNMKNTSEIIKQELRYVQNTAGSKIEKLKYATDVQIGE